MILISPKMFRCRRPISSCAKNIPNPIRCLTDSSTTVINSGINNKMKINDSAVVCEVTALSKDNRDLSLIRPPFPKAFNFAAYVNSSDTLKSLVKLNVDLAKIEKKPHIAEKLLKLDFENDIKPHIFFLSDYIESDAIGQFLTKNPMILEEPLEDMQVRLNYLQSKHFSQVQIKRIISKNPFWLMFSTNRIDARLGYFQKEFSLKGEEVRSLATTQSKIITYNLHHIKVNTFSIKEEMGFSDDEVKELLLKKPKLWLMNQLSLLRRFEYLHNVIKIPHAAILQNPQILECRKFKVKQRHLFLEKLGRAQYDPKKENYVPVMALADGSDLEFCRTYAKCFVDEFNIFLKTIID